MSVDEPKPSDAPKHNELSPRFVGETGLPERRLYVFTATGRETEGTLQIWNLC